MTNNANGMKCLLYICIFISALSGMDCYAQSGDTLSVLAFRHSKDTINIKNIATPVPKSTTSKKDLIGIKTSFAGYDIIPNIESTMMKQENRPLPPHLDSISINPAKQKTIGSTVKSMHLPVTIYYRKNKYTLDSMYLSNRQQLAILDSILISANTEQIDTMTIAAFASPEGHPDYNKLLSGRRANTIRDYILSKYPQIEPHRVTSLAKGENWEGLLEFVLNDPKVPSREKVLEIITSTKDNIQKQRELTGLDGGKTYYRYIRPNYYPYLRTSVSIFITYRPESLSLMNSELPLLTPLQIEKPTIINPMQSLSDLSTTRYPFSLRTNLLYDAVGAFNIGVEIPFGTQKNWSWMTDVAYSFWRSSNNLYALQTLEYGMELRYWFGISDRCKKQKPNWKQPLKGFYIGTYGKYYQRYDVQFIDGYQGDGSWSLGLTGGYAVPLNRRLSLDLGLGAGWFSTSQYRHYHRPEYDENGNYHLMWQETGTWSGLSITKLRVSLVWLFQTKDIKKGGLK